MLKLEVDKQYITREGKVVTIESKQQSSLTGLTSYNGVVGTGTLLYHVGGKLLLCDEKSKSDIAAPIEEAPVLLAKAERKAAALKDKIERLRQLCYHTSSVWDVAPKWAKWLAMDQDGTWRWFKCKPQVGDPQCYPGWLDGLRIPRNQKADVTTKVDDWKLSLQSRPGLVELN